MVKGQGKEVKVKVGLVERNLKNGGWVGGSITIAEDIHKIAKLRTLC